MLTTDVERVQMKVPERMVHEDGAQRAFEHGVFKHNAWQWGETHPGADGVRDRGTHGPEAKYHPYRNLDVTVWAREVPGLPIANHYAVVLGEILGRLRSTATPQIFIGARNHERHRSQGTRNQPERGVGLPWRVLQDRSPPR